MWSNRDWIYPPASYLKQPKTRHIKYVKWFLRHWASGNKGQQFLRDRDKWGESYERPTYCPEKISRPQSRKGEAGWSPVDSLSFRNSWTTRTNKVPRVGWIKYQRAETPGDLRKVPLQYAAGDRLTRAQEETTQGGKRITAQPHTGSRVVHQGHENSYCNCIPCVQKVM